MSAEEAKAVVRQFIEAINRGDSSAIEAALAPGDVDHSLPPGVPPDRAGFLKFITGFRQALRDAHWTVEDLIAEGDKVVGRVTFHGTHQGELLGIPLTDKPATIGGIGLYRLAAGQIAEGWVQRDLLGLLQQLGAMPGPPPAKSSEDATAAPATTPSDGGDPEANKELIRRYWQEASARGMVTVIDTFFAPNLIAHSPASVSPQPIRGREAWTNSRVPSGGAFPT